MEKRRIGSKNNSFLLVVVILVIVFVTTTVVDGFSFEGIMNNVFSRSSHIRHGSAGLGQQHRELQQQQEEVTHHRSDVVVEEKKPIVGGTGTATDETTATTTEETTQKEQVLFDRSVLPIEDQPFNGKIDLRPTDSIKSFPKTITAPKDAPNVLLILTDDVGFGAASTFGGPIETPTLTKLSDRGLKYNTFHTTALCSPTRASLLTGRNHHSVATGGIMEIGTGYPGYTTLIPQSKRGLGDILRENGYNTAWFGKNHNVPDWQTTVAGPFTYWPKGLGFEYFYGFIGGDTSQWDPAIYEDTIAMEDTPKKIRDKKTGEMQDYHFDVDMADKTIEWIQKQKSVAPEKPFFAYYSPGTAHAPHHAPKEWIDKYDGKFTHGWDAQREITFKKMIEMGIIPENTKLTTRPEQIKAWEELDDMQKELFSHMMAVYAGALSHMDHQIGRVVDTIEEMDLLENTLIIYIMGDNGASAEGGPEGVINEMSFFNAYKETIEENYKKMDILGSELTYNHYPAGWAHALCTPFQWTKQVASHLGGTRNGMVISWPAKIKDVGTKRDQFHHVIDIVPTILEAANIPAPQRVFGVEQDDIEGVSMMYTFDAAGADEKSTHSQQYFEMLGNRAMYKDGWIAATTPLAAPWVGEPDLKNLDPIDDVKWELYNVNEDYSESNNLAEKYPEKLEEMKELFYEDARKYNVLPIDYSKINRLQVSNRPSLTEGHNEFIFYGAMPRIPEGGAPDIKNKNFEIHAKIRIQDDTEGVIVAHGSRWTGYSLFIQEGKLNFHYNFCDADEYKVTASSDLGLLDEGEKEIMVKFNYNYDEPGNGFGNGGDLYLYIDGEEVATETLVRTIGYRMSLDETFDVGSDVGTPVASVYESPFKFTGMIDRLVVKIDKQTDSSKEEL